MDDFERWLDSPGLGSRSDERSYWSTGEEEEDPATEGTEAAESVTSIEDDSLFSNNETSNGCRNKGDKGSSKTLFYIEPVQKTLTAIGRSIAGPHCLRKHEVTKSVVAEHLRPPTTTELLVAVRRVDIDRSHVIGAANNILLGSVGTVLLPFK
eukprot:GHVS01027956.1.p3 GENE.GHVS01027956.1~~GHVS01027956.1.p3  ORF type:complete len:153 (-),score=16.88 GHVS01027956.1:600-1058(-)